MVITGGEPFLQEELPDLIRKLTEKGHYVTVETNGTLYLENQAQFLSISPKLSSSCSEDSDDYADHQKTRWQPDILVQMIQQHDVQLKYVVNTKADIKEIKEQLQILQPQVKKNLNELVYLMPQGIRKEDLDEKAEWIIEEVKANHWNYTDRLHIRTWGAKRAK